MLEPGLSWKRIWSLEFSLLSKFVELPREYAERWLKAMVDLWSLFHHWFGYRRVSSSGFASDSMIRSEPEHSFFLFLLNAEIIITTEISSSGRLYLIRHFFSEIPCSASRPLLTTLPLLSLYWDVTTVDSVHYAENHRVSFILKYALSDSPFLPHQLSSRTVVCPSWWNDAWAWNEVDESDRPGRCLRCIRNDSSFQLTLYFTRASLLRFWYCSPKEVQKRKRCINVPWQS